MYKTSLCFKKHVNVILPQPYLIKKKSLTLIVGRLELLTLLSGSLFTMKNNNIKKPPTFRVKQWSQNSAI